MKWHLLPSKAPEWNVHLFLVRSVVQNMPVYCCEWHELLAWRHLGGTDGSEVSNSCGTIPFKVRRLLTLQGLVMTQSHQGLFRKSSFSAVQFLISWHSAQGWAQPQPQLISANGTPLPGRWNLCSLSIPRNLLCSTAQVAAAQIPVPGFPVLPGNVHSWKDIPLNSTLHKNLCTGCL